MLKKKSKLNAMELERELEWDYNMNKLKVLINVNWKKKMLLIERLIGTEKEEEYIFKRVHDFW